MALACDVCFSYFDLARHRPKSLPCGHTICSVCALHPALGRKCPTCRKDLETDAGDLPDNILAIRMMEGAEGAAPHDARVRQVQQLQRGVEVGRQVVQQLRRLVPVAVEALNNQLASSVAQLRQMEQALERLQLAGEESVSLDPRTAQQLQGAAYQEDSLRLLSSKSSKVSVVAEEGEATWRASVQLGSFDQVVRLVLLQLLSDGQLHKVDPYVGPPKLSVFSIDDKDVDREGLFLNVNNILQDRRRWRNTRILKNFRGGCAEDLLQAMTPYLNLEEIELHTLEPAVLVQVENLTSLKKLIVCCQPGLEGYPDLPLQLEELSITHPTENQLYCLQRMSKLRSLEVRHYWHGQDVSFPPSPSRALLWLGVAFNKDRKSTMLSLINSHAASLQELQVRCSYEHGCTYFPHLGRELAGCRLRALRRLVLERPLLGALDKCPETDACRLQLQTIRRSLPETVDVLCMHCDKSAL
ncbi:uncharacterized protein LOC113209827 [Frankliniella occidentalis]|uniref:Uncharacterized protein LOC113209827 n=1 Tax=Frankliniella occidentalis TaxID=133901 RepID=A0A6J1SQZ5_FRAOC|nr:uncharacterized protein LOC113209827 [Frankliniella occidentalis]